jgi:hypothetical protein
MRNELQDVEIRRNCIDKMRRGETTARRDSALLNAGSNERPVWVFLASALSVYFVLVLGTGALAAIPYLIFLISPGILVGWFARHRIQENEAAISEKTKQGCVMVFPGYPPGKGKALGYQLSIAALLNYFVSAVATEFLIGRVTLPQIIQFILPVFHFFTAVFVVLAVFAAWEAWGYFREFRKSETTYVSPNRIPVHDTVQMAKEGLVILGHEFKHAAHESVSEPVESDEAISGEIKSRTRQIRIGNDGPFMIDLDNEVNPHCIVFGATGTGKSITVKALLLRYWLAKRIPFLVIDWMPDYSSFTKELGGVVWSVPTNFTVNPLRLGGFTPSQRIAQVEQALVHSLALTTLQATAVGQILRDAYTEAGIDQQDETTWTRPSPTWDDLIRIIDSKLSVGQYAGQQLESVRWAILKLHRGDGIFGDEPNDFFDTVLSRPTCIDLSGLLGADDAKMIVTYTILQRINHQFQISGVSALKLLVVIDEAHLILEKELREGSPEESLPVEIIRLGRKYGFGEILATQLATEIPNKAMANAGTIVAMKHQAPQEVNYVTKLVSLSKPELQIYRRLPIGGAFVKLLSDDIPRLVKVQRVSPNEISSAKSLTKRIEKEKPSIPIVVSASKTRPIVTMREPDRALEDLTSVQRRILRFLETSPPATVAKIRERFPEVDYREMLELLEDLKKEDLVQEQKVANLEGKGTVFYGALKAEWLQSESLEHRAMIQMIMEALAKWHPIHFAQTKADSPDIGLESMEPKGCIEVETGRKKLTPTEIDEWAKGVTERDERLGYKDILIVVPNETVGLHYNDAAVKYGLELTTMAKLGKAHREGGGFHASRSKTHNLSMSSIGVNFSRFGILEVNC